MTRMLDTDDETVTRAALVGLGRFNLIVGLLHLAQAAAMFALSNDLSFPITASFLTGDPVLASTSGCSTGRSAGGGITCSANAPTSS